MTTLFISDIHADIRSLIAVFALTHNHRFTRRYGDITHVYCLGDMVERDDHPALVIEFLRGLKNLECVIGNHDEALMWGERIGGGDMQSEIAHQTFKNDGGCDFFAGLPTRIVDPAKRLILAHGGINTIHCEGNWVDKWLVTHTWQRLSYEDRQDKYCGYLYSPMTSFKTARELIPGDQGRIIVVGHNHREMAFSMTDHVRDLTPIRESHARYESPVYTYGTKNVTLEYKMTSRPVPINPTADYQFAIGSVLRDDDTGEIHFATLDDHREQFTMFSFMTTQR